MVISILRAAGQFRQRLDKIKTARLRTQVFSTLFPFAIKLDETR